MIRVYFWTNISQPLPRPESPRGVAARGPAAQGPRPACHQLIPGCKHMPAACPPQSRTFSAGPGTLLLALWFRRLRLWRHPAVAARGTMASTVEALTRPARRRDRASEAIFLLGVLLLLLPPVTGRGDITGTFLVVFKLFRIRYDIFLPLYSTIFI